MLDVRAFSNYFFVIVTEMTKLDTYLLYRLVFMKGARNINVKFGTKFCIYVKFQKKLEKIASKYHR